MNSAGVCHPGAAATRRRAWRCAALSWSTVEVRMCRAKWLVFGMAEPFSATAGGFRSGTTRDSVAPLSTRLPDRAAAEASLEWTTGVAAQMCCAIDQGGVEVLADVRRCRCDEVFAVGSAKPAGRLTDDASPDRGWRKWPPDGNPSSLSALADWLNPRPMVAGARTPARAIYECVTGCARCQRQTQWRRGSPIAIVHFAVVGGVERCRAQPPLISWPVSMRTCQGTPDASCLVHEPDS
jgi:hypothetical protein